MADRRDCAVEEHTCTCCNGCNCASPCEGFCFATRENGAVPEGDAVGQSGCTETCASGAIKEGNTTEEVIVVEENISISTKTSLAIDIQTGIREHPCVGRYQIQTTSSQWNWCGVFALGISTFWQLGKGMTADQFSYIYFHLEDMWAFMRQRDYNNVENFFDDQLAMVLRLWGRIEGLNPNLQLGVILEDADCAYIIGEDDKFLPVSSEEEMEGERELKTVWIHNDNAQALTGGRMNHYSGIRLLDRRAEQVGGSKGEGAKEEDPGMEMEQQTEEQSSEEDSSTLSEEESSAEKDSDVEMADDEASGQETGEETPEDFLMLSDEESTYVEDSEEMGPKTEEEVFLSKYSSMLPHGVSSAEEGSDAEMADDEMGQETEEGHLDEDSSMPSEQESTGEGSEMEMEDDEEMRQGADEGKFAEDSRHECSCDPAEERESKRRRVC